MACTLGPLQLRYYGLCFAGGFIAGYLIMQRLFRRRGYDTAALDSLLVYLFAGTVLGARLGHCLIYEPDYFLQHPLEILMIHRGGLASHGGTLGIVLAFLLWCVRHRRYHFLEIADMLTIPVALEGSLIRIGNFLNSEITGLPWDGPWAVVFVRTGDPVPRHPVQLYESAAYLTVAAVLALIYRLRPARPAGMLLALAMIAIFGVRMVLEQFKPEQAAYSTGLPLTVGQLLSIPFIMAGAALLVCTQLRRPRS